MSDCEDPTWFSSPPQDKKVEEFRTREEDGPGPFTNPGESVSASATVLLRTVSSNLQKIKAIPAVRENDTPSPAASPTNEVQPHSGCLESKPMVLCAEQENKLADAQAEQTGDTEQVKRYYLTAKKLDCIVEASKQGESDNASSFLPPSESKLDEKQNVSPQSSDEPHAETKNSGSLQNEIVVNSPVVPDLVTVCADPTVRSADMETGEVLSTLPFQNSLCPDTSHQYNQLIELLHQQEEKCKKYCQQFSHMGNIAETTRFESLAEECASHIEALRVAKVKGYPVPKFHMEDRTFNIFRIIPELSGSDMLLTIVRGVNLPVPEGGSPNDLETSVRFEFAFPSLQEAQRDQTRSVKNSSSPEFGEQFTLHIKRNHRGFKRVVLSKGIKFEIIQKGGLFKTDKVVGCAQLKLDSLESKCEIRQLIEVLKRRTPTGGHLEVRVKIREPLSGPQSDTVTEKWLVLDPLTLPLIFPVTTCHHLGHRSSLMTVSRVSYTSHDLGP